MKCPLRRITIYYNWLFKTQTLQENIQFKSHANIIFNNKPFPSLMMWCGCSLNVLQLPKDMYGKPTAFKASCKSYNPFKFKLKNDLKVQRLCLTVIVVQECMLVIVHLARDLNYYMRELLLSYFHGFQ